MDEQHFARLSREILGFFDDPAVDELLINGAGSACLVASGRLSLAEAPFKSVAELALWCQNWARRLGVRLDPVVGAAGGSFQGHSFRWHCVLPPIAPDGPLFSLRRHRFELLNLSSFRLTSEQLGLIKEAMVRRSNLLICGPTGCGKTTILASLLKEFAPDERVIIVESLPELPLPTPYSARLIERQANLEQIGAVSLERLLRESLRLRPDRLVVGEVRGPEAKVFCEALMSGHEGVMATIHAASPSDAMAKLSYLAGMSSRSSSSPQWAGVPIEVLLMRRGVPPGVESLTKEAFVPSA
ncbi:MAG: hypothetical protein RL011_694 [Pseudomonadota bacterium]